MGMFSSKTAKPGKTCGHKSSHPFSATCSKPAGHGGKHGARGMSWGNDGRIPFGKRGGRK